MEINELCEIIGSKARKEALSRLLADRKNRTALIDGLAGSAAPMLFSQLPKGKEPYLIIANDLDEAGYAYHDLCQIMGEGAVLMFPSGYKRDIKYGQVDAPQEILRTEVLNRWHTDRRLHCVVTYPEALAEKVQSRDKIEESTVTLTKDTASDLTEVSGRLKELGFTEVDYVYEPGQFAVRGSILDVFSFSFELPYRIDYFGDEIESIRTFNVETQLSVENVDSIAIINGTGSDSNSGTSFLEYIGDKAVLLCHDHRWLLSRIEAIAAEKFSESALIAEEGDKDAMKKIVDAEAFARRFAQFRRIDYREGRAASGEEAAGGKAVTSPEAHLHLHCTPQGIYHKNFDIISTSFKDFIARGYRIFILSDSAKQTERLRVIFEDRKDEITFTPILHTLHEGFVDDDQKLCVFTDHQIFDRFHKYSLKSDRARSGKLAFSLKELNQIEVGDYIVHVDHGVGKFGGLLRTDVNGKMQEMIKLI